MKKSALRMVLAVLVAVAGLASPPQDANAVPTLQLGVAGGSYDSATETIFSSGPSFALYAFLTPDSQNLLGDTYYLSMALTPPTSAPATLGSFSYNGNTVNVTGDMTFGNPPIDSFFPELPSHGVFDTYYKEVAFAFSSADQSGVFNTQDHPSWGPQTGSGMYYTRFDIDTTNLASGYEIHFDLYNTNLVEKCMGNQGCSLDGNTQFAPFSHDAQSFTTPVPEPEIYAMLAAGLGLMGFVARRRKQQGAVI